MNFPLEDGTTEPRPQGASDVSGNRSSGSVFHFTAWFKKTASKKVKRTAVVSLKGKKVLIVDDNLANLNILNHVLESVGMRVVSLSSGEQAVEILKNAFRDGDPFDLCILDIQMPVLSGYDVARRDPQFWIVNGKGNIENPQRSSNRSVLFDGKGCQKMRTGRL